MIKTYKTIVDMLENLHLSVINSTKSSFIMNSHNLLIFLEECVNACNNCALPEFCGRV